MKENAMSQEMLNAEGIARALDELTDAIHSATTKAPVAIVGIRRGGEHLARRLVELINKKYGQALPLGFVDIALYRDDGFGPSDFPKVGVTDIPFRPKEHTIVLVDDVLYTGRTVRSALGAILDYGRPCSVRLAVMVDRGLRELPIQADWVGLSLVTTAADHVDVVLTEGGSEADSVVMTTGGNGAQA
jgi:pyrimidine operon attenuation protein/uracil phosphoribosyltransferase